MFNRGYHFKTWKERLMTAGSAASALAVAGIGASFLFNPVVFAGAAAFGILSALHARLSLQRDIRKMLSNGQLTPVAEDAPINSTVKSIGKRLGRMEAPQVYIVKAEDMAPLIFPFGLRWFGKTKRGKALIAKSMPSLFGAVTGTDVIVTSEEALTNGYTARENHFIAAHEIAHLQTDANSPVDYSRIAVKRMTRPLFAVAAVAAVSGVGLPLAAGISAVEALYFLAISKFAADTALNFGQRVKERRADRNALYITRDLNAAQETMMDIHTLEEREKSVLSDFRSNLFSDHPSYLRRMEALEDAFNDVSRYPALPGTPSVPRTWHPHRPLGGFGAEM